FALELAAYDALAGGEEAALGGAGEVVVDLAEGAGAVDGDGGGKGAGGRLDGVPVGVQAEGRVVGFAGVVAAAAPGRAGLGWKAVDRGLAVEELEQPAQVLDVSLALRVAQIDLAWGEQPVLDVA